MKNIWGNTPANDENNGDDYVSGRRGALSSKSKNLGDGHWCPVCYNVGKYSWVSGPPRCEICKTVIADMDTDMISKIMRKR